jgi:prepilin-type N-terminal cleavage/methylation domain-containing protein
MKKTFSKKKSAFSLIELSIVLIVIGLLIAGITGGASLIKSSELRSVMGEARGYSVAVNAFYSQFNALPGDYGTGVGTATAGNGDGKIEYYGTGSVSESASAWQALKAIGAVDTITAGATAAATTAPVFGTTAPASKIKSSGWAFDYRTLAEGASTGVAANQNVVVLTGAIGTTGLTAGSVTLVQGSANVASAAITGADALSIDAKIDDNFAQTGKVRGLNPAATDAGCYSITASATSAYITTSTSKVCALTYQIDVNS